MTKETLQSDLEKVLDKKGIFYTRLRTPNYGYRGVRYPGDYVIWGRRRTWLVECKQRKSLPLAPSDIRQMKFMQKWDALSYEPNAGYIILVGTGEGYFVFSSGQAVIAKENRKGLRKEQAIYFSESLEQLIIEMEELW